MFSEELLNKRPGIIPTFLVIKFFPHLRAGILLRLEYFTGGCALIVISFGELPQWNPERKYASGSVCGLRMDSVGKHGDQAIHSTQ